MPVTESELRKAFSSNLKNLRTQLKLSQGNLAKKTGVSVNFINDLEAEKKWTSITTLVNLANALNVEAYELLKPPDLFPDNLGAIIKKITDDIKEAVDQTRLDFLQSEAAVHKKM